MYTSADFRNNLKTSFNEADNGREVLIDRYGDIYQLVAKVGTPDPNGSYPRSMHDEIEDDGRPALAGQEHTVRFELPPPPAGTIRFNDELRELKKSFKPDTDYKGYMVHQVIDARLDTILGGNDLVATNNQSQVEPLKSAPTSPPNNVKDKDD